MRGSTHITEKRGSMNGPRTLILDIETSPNLGYVWSLFNQNVHLNQLVEASRVMCFAAKWHGEEKMMFWSEFHHGHDKMLDRAYALVDEADIVVHYNGQKFDMRHLNREWWLAGKSPPSPIQQVDLLKVVRKIFYLPSNKLDYVASLEGEGKLDHGGFELWLKCLLGDPKAWALMRKYCKQDVLITEHRYDSIRPWIPNHPHMGLYSTDASIPRCANCGSENLQKRGFFYTSLAKYQRYRCMNCGHWSREGKAESRVDVRGAN